MVRQICATIAILSIGLLSAFGIQKNSFKDIDMNAPPARQKLLMDLSWKFHLGNAADPEKDFEFGMTAPFSKAGQASGPAIPDFKDSTWRTVDLPHDWASELGFVHVDDRNLDSHGYKPLGRQFPETSIGWYRRSFP
jgi:beta-galactosidase